MKQTTLIKTADIDKKWYVVDAEGQVLGRLATQIATILRGKHKVDYTFNMNNGDHVIVINAEKVVVTGKKFKDKIYFKHSLYPGGLSRTSFETKQKLKPEAIIERAVRLMLSKNVQGSNQYRALHVYKGPAHPHQAQNPEILNFSKGDN